MTMLSHEAIDARLRLLEAAVFANPSEPQQTYPEEQASPLASGPEADQAADQT